MGDTDYFFSRGDDTKVFEEGKRYGIRVVIDPENIETCCFSDTDFTIKVNGEPVDYEKCGPNDRNRRAFINFEVLA